MPLVKSYWFDLEGISGKMAAGENRLRYVTYIRQYVRAFDSWATEEQIVHRLFDGITNHAKHIKGAREKECRCKTWTVWYSRRTVTMLNRPERGRLLQIIIQDFVFFFDLFWIKSRAHSRGFLFCTDDQPFICYSFLSVTSDILSMIKLNLLTNFWTYERCPCVLV